MASSSLFPPNAFKLSDAVIAGVVQRVAPLHANDDNQFIGRKRLPSLRFVAHVDRNETVVDIAPPPTAETKGGRTLKVSASRRERCRINQARYRNRQRQHADKLDEGIQQLQEEIQELETKRQYLARCAPTDQNVWAVATEYFRVFRHGFMTPLDLPETVTTGTPSQQESSVQLDFLKRTMVSYVTDGIACGAESHLENWRLLSLYHDDVQLELKRLEQVGVDSLLATSILSVTITKHTLQQVYPHIMEGNELSPLAVRLLNQRLVVRGSAHFEWDDTTGRVVRLENKFDMLTPMLKLLGSLEAVARVFDKAFVTLDGRCTM